MKTTFRAFLPLLLAAPLFCQGEVDLRTTAKKGASVWLLQEMKVEQTIDMGGQQMESGQQITRAVHVAVKDVDDKGNLVVEVKLARVHGSITMPMGMGDTEFDSAKPAEEGGEDDGMGGMVAMMTKSMTAGAGKSFTAKVSPYGKVVELIDAKEILAAGGGGGMMGGQGINEDELRSMAEGAFGALPEKPTAPGAKWTRSEKDGGRMPATSKLEMTLAKADADGIEITVVGTVEKPADSDKGADGEEMPEGMAEMLKSMKISNGKVSGTEKISRKDGFVTESSTAMTMDVEMEAGPMGSMQMSMKNTKTVKRTTEEAAMPKKVEAPKTGEPAKKDEKPAEKKEGK